VTLASSESSLRMAEDNRLGPDSEVRGLAKVDWLFVFASAAFDLIRLPKLLPRPA
jgi:hypothetical protein